MFELVHLRCFVAVAEELHFGRAAGRMNMTQPPLSRHIQVLERILGVALFHRTSRSVSLTAAGSAFLGEARRLVQMADNAAAIARSAAEGREGLLTLGFTAASGYGLLPRLLAHVAGILPNVRYLMKELVSGEQIEALVAGRLDLGLLRPPVRHSELASRPIARERFIACSPAALPEAERPRHLTDFDGLPVIMYAPDTSRYFHDLATGLFASVGAVPRLVQHLGQVHSILSLVGAGFGHALVPAAASRLHPEGVAFTVLDDVEPLVETHAAWLDSNRSPLLAQFLTAIGSFA